MYRRYIWQQKKYVYRRLFNNRSIFVSEGYLLIKVYTYISVGIFNIQQEYTCIGGMVKRLWFPWSILLSTPLEVYTPLIRPLNIHSSPYHPTREYKDYSQHQGKMREIENSSNRKTVQKKQKIVETLYWRGKYMFIVKNVLSLVLGGEMGA